MEKKLFINPEIKIFNFEIKNQVIVTSSYDKLGIFDLDDNKGLINPYSF